MLFCSAVVDAFYCRLLRILVQQALEKVTIIDIIFINQSFLKCTLSIFHHQIICNAPGYKYFLTFFAFFIRPALFFFLHSRYRHTNVIGYYNDLTGSFSLKSGKFVTCAQATVRLICEDDISNIFEKLCWAFLPREIMAVKVRIGIASLFCSLKYVVVR